MQMDNLTQLCKTGTAEDVKNFLSQFGSSKWTGTDGYGYGISGNCIDKIIDGVLADKDDARRALKKTLVAQYEAGTGPFSKGQDVPPDVIKEFRDTIAELTEKVDAIPALVEVIEMLAQEVAKLSKPETEPSGKAKTPRVPAPQQ